MANIASAKKRARQSEVHRQLNVQQRSKLRTSIKTVLKGIEAGDQKQATEAYKKALPIIDRMATKKIIHKNRAARYKSRLTAKIKGLKEASA